MPLCLINIAKRHQDRVTNDSFHLENAWCCVITDLSLLIYANLYNEFSVLVQYVI